MLKRTSIALSLAGLLAAAPLSLAGAQDKEKIIPGEFAATIAITSDYIFRGTSQTDTNPAVQATIDYTYMFNDSIGIYLGVFGSNVDFNDGDEAHLEIDAYGGIKGEVAGFAWSLGFIRYIYPGAASALNYDYTEIVGKLGYDFGFASITGGIYYSPEFPAESGDAFYYTADVGVPLPFLPLDPSLAFHVGRQTIDKNDRFGLPDYTDWSVGIAAKIDNFTLMLQYVDTNIDRDECFGGRKVCESRAVLTLSASF